MEIWRDVLEYEGLYQVSSKGRVKRVTSGRILKANVRFSNNGKYKRTYVALSKQCVETQYYIHKLVAYAFPEICGEWFEGAEIDHIDGDATNNNATNLRFVTHTENMNNPISRERISKGNCGHVPTENHKKKTRESLTNNPLTSKKILQYDLDGNFVREWESISEAKRNGYLNVPACLSGKQKKAHNCLWTYKEERVA